MRKHQGKALATRPPCHQRYAVKKQQLTWGMLKVVYVFLVPIEGEHAAVNAAYLFECLPTVAPLRLDSESALVIWAHEPLG